MPTAIPMRSDSFPALASCDFRLIGTKHIAVSKKKAKRCPHMNTHSPRGTYQVINRRLESGDVETSFLFHLLRRAAAPKEEAPGVGAAEPGAGEHEHEDRQEEVGAR